MAVIKAKYKDYEILSDNGFEISKSNKLAYTVSFTVRKLGVLCYFEFEVSHLYKALNNSLNQGESLDKLLKEAIGVIKDYIDKDKIKHDEISVFKFDSSGLILLHTQIYK